MTSLEQRLRKSFGSQISPVEEPLLEEVVKQQLLKAFKAYCPHWPALEERFALPKGLVDMLNFLPETASQDLSDGTWWSLLLCYDQMVAELEYFLDDYQSSCSRAEAEIDAETKLMLPIGFWSDKHVYFICCEKGEDLGAIYDCYDSYFFDFDSLDRVEVANLEQFISSEYPESKKTKGV